MQPTTRVTIAAAEDPLTIAEACAHLRMEVGQDDTKILAAVRAATQQIEQTYGVAMVSQTLATVYQSWPCVFTLSRGPVTAISSITYTLAGGTPTTLATTEWAKALNARPVLVSPAYGKTWPSGTLEVLYPIEVTFVAGHANAAAVPAELKQAVGILAHSMYFNRESGGSDPKVLASVRHCLGNRRLW